MNISELIGKTINKIRYTYTYRNQYDIQEFFAYLKLSNGVITGIPQYHDIDITENETLNKLFKEAKKPNSNCLKQIENQKIVDFHFWFFENEQDIEKKAYIELESGIYVSEENFGPIGLTTVDLEILTPEAFEKLKDGLSKGLEIKSYLKELQNIC